MADAKVIPFDDDRSRGSAVHRPPRRRGAGSRLKGETAGVREVQPLPGRTILQDDVPVTDVPVTPEETASEPERQGGG